MCRASLASQSATVTNTLKGTSGFCSTSKTTGMPCGINSRTWAGRAGKRGRGRLQMDGRLGMQSLQETSGTALWGTKIKVCFWNCAVRMQRDDSPGSSTGPAL